MGDGHWIRGLGSWKQQVHADQVKSMELRHSGFYLITHDRRVYNFVTHEGPWGIDSILIESGKTICVRQIYLTTEGNESNLPLSPSWTTGAGMQ